MKETTKETTQETMTLTERIIELLRSTEKHMTARDVCAALGYYNLNCVTAIMAKISRGESPPIVRVGHKSMRDKGGRTQRVLVYGRRSPDNMRLAEKNHAITAAKPRGELAGSRRKIRLGANYGLSFSRSLHERRSASSGSGKIAGRRMPTTWRPLERNVNEHAQLALLTRKR